MRPALAGQVALVTGAAQRLGRAIALELAASGADILVHYHSSDDVRVNQTLTAIRAQGVQAQAQQADLGAAAGVERLFAGLRQHFGRLDILVNSAALFQQRRLLEVSAADWERTMAVNLRAPFLCTQAAARLMRAQEPPGGLIINLLDRGVDGPWQAYAHHGVSKAALWALTQVRRAGAGAGDSRQRRAAGAGPARGGHERGTLGGGHRSESAGARRLSGGRGAGGHFSGGRGLHQRRGDSRQRRRAPGSQTRVT